MGILENRRWTERLDTTMTSAELGTFLRNSPNPRTDGTSFFPRGRHELIKNMRVTGIRNFARILQRFTLGLPTAHTSPKRPRGFWLCRLADTSG